MQRLMGEGFIVSHNLETAPIPRGLILSGRVHCQHGLFVDVYKVYAIENRRGRPWIKAEQYKYHAGVEGDEDRPIFRYDNAHPYPSHADSYHKHRFDHTTWKEIKPPVWIGRAHWPHLSDVIEELRVWWEQTGQFLDWS